MTDYGPGPCEVCGEDVEGHTAKELRKCIALLPADEEQEPSVRWSPETKPRNGRTIVQALFQELWKELDTIVDHIMSQDAPEVPAGPEPGRYFYPEDVIEIHRYGEWRGQAQGVAYALAVLTNPYAPDVDKIRAEAMKRWEAGEEG